MGTEEVIELSINETQALRAKLGLPPLRGVPSSSASGRGSGTAYSSTTEDNNHNSSSSSATKNDKEIALSIEETNKLRIKIGLPPLRTSNSDKKQGSSISTAIHAPPTNTQAESEARKRIEDAAAKREAADRLKKLEIENEKDAKGEESALDFAAKMMAKNTHEDGKIAESNNDDGKKKKRKKKKKKKKTLGKNSNPQLLSLPSGDDDDEEEEEYTSADLKGIKVSHATSDFEAGTTTVLTLADKSILDVDSDSKKATGLGNYENELVNVNMDNDTQALQNLKRKRAIELGAGRAGGYAGYDDDEFEELGGVGTAGAMPRSGGNGENGGGGNNGQSSGGFAIGADGTAKESKDSKKSDIFSTFSGGAVSLQSRHAKKVASDFMSYEPEELESREETLEKERAKQQKILEKLRKKDKKKAKKANKKKKSKRSYESEEDSGNEDVGGNGGGGSLLANLEATAVKDTNPEKRKRRRRDGDDDAMDVDNGKAKDDDSHEGTADDAVDDMAEKRKRFDQIMEKGKVRTDRAFNRPTSVFSSSTGETGGDDDADDDAFLNAALAKARRLKRLKEMSSNGGTKTNGVKVKGEDAVVQAVEKIKKEEAAAKVKEEGENNGGGNGKSGITFEFDEMQEFTRALRAREDQAKRSGNVADKRSRGVKATVPGTKEKDSEKVHVKVENNDAEVLAEEGVEDVDMEELAQEMTDADDVNNNENEDAGVAFGTTAESAPIGRGMSNFLSLLKQTGEIKTHSNKEEMRGRAKDERTYNDYEQLDLKKVVNVDTKRHNAHEKDVEFANREIKLEYRDDFGRLLTRKEAYRNMCYQFHGHGSSKKNQERRLKQVEREREETTRASRGQQGTLGALKATQKATGKAFIIHKT